MRQSLHRSSLSMMMSHSEVIMKAALRTVSLQEKTYQAVMKLQSELIPVLGFKLAIGHVIDYLINQREIDQKQLASNKPKQNATSV